MTYETTSAERQADQAAFARKVKDSLDDPTIRGFFERKLVQRDDVIETLVNGPAFEQAIQRKSYWPFAKTSAKLRDTRKLISAIFSSDAVNARTVVVLASAIALVVFLLVEVFQAGLATIGATFVATISAGISARLLAIARTQPKRRLRRLTLSFITMSISLCAIILPHILIRLAWTPFNQFILWALALIVCYFLSIGQTINECTSLLLAGRKKSTLFLQELDVSSFQKKWLDDCVDDIIMPQATLAINAILG
jgi:hypothetical protein